MIPFNTLHSCSIRSIHRFRSNTFLGVNCLQLQGPGHPWSPSPIPISMFVSKIQNRAVIKDLLTHLPTKVRFVSSWDLGHTPGYCICGIFHKLFNINANRILFAKNILKKIAQSYKTMWVTTIREQSIEILLMLTMKPLFTGILETN